MTGFRAISESLILTVVVAAANALFGASDPGWLGLNPTPYVLVPILVGMRYGLVSGVIGGLIAALLCGTGASVFGGQMFAAIMTTHAFTLLAMPFLGAVAGEVHRTLSTRAQGVVRRAETLEDEVARLRTDLALAQECQGELQEQLAMHGAQFSSADIELGKLFGAEAGPLLPGTLAALDDLCDVGAAAFYRLGTRDELELDCAHGDVGRFVDPLVGDAANIARVALDQGQLVTCRKLVQTGEASGEFIAALPLELSGGRFVLVIADMPFAAVNWQNFARVEVFCEWVAQTEIGGVNGASVLGRDALHERFKLAAKTVAEQGLPSTVVLFTATADHIDQNTIESAVLPQLNGAEIAGTVGRDGPHLAVLLPMGGAREAGRLVEAAGKQLAGESYLIRSAESADEIWKALTDVA